MFFFPTAENQKLTDHVLSNSIQVNTTFLFLLSQTNLRLCPQLKIAQVNLCDACFMKQLKYLHEKCGTQIMKRCKKLWPKANSIRWQ